MTGVAGLTTAVGATSHVVVTAERDDHRMATQQEITSFVTRRFGLPLPAGPWPTLDHAVAGPRPPTTSAEDCARALVRDEEFRALQLGTWLNSPDGEVIAAAVQAALPQPYGYEAKVIIEGLQIAAKEQRRQGLKTAGVVSLIGLGGLLLTIFGRPG